MLLRRFITLAVLAAALHTAQAQTTDVRTQLRGLALVYGFQLDGLEYVPEGTPGVTPTSDLERDLANLLSGYSFAVLRHPSGAVKQVRLLSRDSGTGPIDPVKNPKPVSAPGEVKSSVSPTRVAEVKPTYRVQAKREDGTHTVLTFLAGHGGEGDYHPLAVDMGGNAVVLPLSMSESLGYDIESLSDGSVHSALMGPLRGKVATLKMLRINNVVSRSVPVVFVEQAILGERALLGTQSLSDFSVTLNESDNELVFVLER